MSDFSKRDEMKSISAKEFSSRLKEYARKIKRANKASVPNEPVGQINKSKLID
ncbi:hypothetical protein [Sessilibacter sp. MAH4]